MSTLASERATRSISWVNARNWRLEPISSAVPLRVIRPRPIGTACRRPHEWRPNCRCFELWLIRDLLVQGSGQSRFRETFSPKPLFFEELRVSWWSSVSVQFRSLSLPKRDTDDKSLPIGRLPLLSSVSAGQTFVGPLSKNRVRSDEKLRAARQLRVIGGCFATSLRSGRPRLRFGRREHAHFYTRLHTVGRRAGSLRSRGSAGAAPASAASSRRFRPGRSCRDAPSRAGRAGRGTRR